MLGRILLILCGLATAVAFVLSCSAPHDNPLDPASDFYVPPPDTQIVPTVPTFGTSLRTVHIARFGVSSQSFYVQVDAWPISNVEIDSASIQYLSGTKRQLTLFGGMWSASLSPSAVGVDALEEVIGNPFMFQFYVAGDTTVYTKGPCYVFRVLDEVPQTSSPDSNAVVDTPYPMLAWPLFSSPYPSRLRVELKRVDELIWSSDTLSVTNTQIAVPDSLEDDTYWWALFVYDNFNNSTRSREAYFVVNADTTQ